LKEKVEKDIESLKKYHLSSTLRKLVHSPKKHLSFSLDKDHKPLNQLILDKLEKFEIYSKSAENSFLGGVSKKDQTTKVISIS
jgi:type I site-specific restriction endonuclease